MFTLTKDKDIQSKSENIRTIKLAKTNTDKKLFNI